MRLALGSVQFGVAYGVTNKEGKVSRGEVNNILATAEKNGIKIIDTAPGYGDSEAVLGQCSVNRFSVISKIPSMQKGSFEFDIERSVRASLTTLEIDCLHGIMLHDERDAIGDDSNRIFDELSELKRKGLVNGIGASFYNPEALAKAMDMHEIDIIQIPANCLDQRFHKSGLLRLAKEKSMEVHARSLFLQGLLLSKMESLPEALTPHKGEISGYFEYARQNGLTPLELALAYLDKNSNIDYGVVGCITEEQLNEIISAYRNIESANVDLDFDILSSSSNLLVNPSLWR